MGSLDDSVARAQELCADFLATVGIGMGAKREAMLGDNLGSF